MGLFGSKAVPCDICGTETGVSRNEKHPAKDGVVCHGCYVAAGFPASISVSLMPVSLLKEQIESTDGVSITKRFKAQGGEGPVGVAPENITVKKKGVLDELAEEGRRRMSEPIKCPRCGSEQISADKKGFGIGKAVIGNAIAGPIGLAAGNIGAKKVRITCLKCGNSWMAGKG